MVIHNQDIPIHLRFLFFSSQFAFENQTLCFILNIHLLFYFIFLQALILIVNIFKVFINYCWFPLKYKISWIGLKLRHFLDQVRILLIVMRVYFELESEWRTFAHLWLERDIAFILLHDLFWNSKTQTNAILVLQLWFLEEAE